MKVKIKKLHPDAVVPTYATDGSACFDIHAIEDRELSPCGGNVILSTGLSFEIPEGHVMLVYSRSGHGFKNDVRLSNATGVIDSDYRGELKVKLRNENLAHRFEVKKGDRIAQAMILPIQQVDFEVVNELTETERGTGGFGSTGS